MDLPLPIVHRDFQYSHLSDEELSDLLSYWLAIFKTNSKTSWDAMAVLMEYVRRHTKEKRKRK